VLGKKPILYKVIPFLIIASIFMSSCGTQSPKKLESQPKTNQPEPSKKINNVNNSSSNKKAITSGRVDEVPWANDQKFKAAQQKNQALKQMAAFRTVLIDPLPGEEENVHLAARLLAGTVVQPGKVFSQNTTIGPYSKARGFQEGPLYIGTKLGKTIGGGVCKIASTLYNVTVFSDLEVIERHAHGMPVPYVPYGQDATVSYGFKDFKFKNNTANPILIWAQGIDNTLYIAFYSKQAAPRVEWHHKVLKSQKADLIYRNNKELPVGTERVAVKGMDGALIDSWVTIYEQNGKSRNKALGQSSYLPMPEIVERGK
jgi:vancomycin resistance protein VanW